MLVVTDYAQFGRQRRLMNVMRRDMSALNAKRQSPNKRKHREDMLTMLCVAVLFGRKQQNVRKLGVSMRRVKGRKKDK